MATPPAGDVTMAYDPEGLRVEKESTSETRKFIYHFEKVLQETDGTGNVEQEYTSTTALFGNLISEFGGTDTEYHNFDALGSTDSLTNAAQTSTADWVYRAFGQVESKTGIGETNLTFVGKFGYYWDPVTGQYLLGQRYYDPLTARFTSQDPLGLEFFVGLRVVERPELYFGPRYYDPELERFVGTDQIEESLNLYLYVFNQPVRHVDPTGLEEMPQAKLRPGTRFDYSRELTDPQSDDYLSDEQRKGIETDLKKQLQFLNDNGGGTGKALVFMLTRRPFLFS